MIERCVYVLREVALLEGQTLASTLKHPSIEMMSRDDLGGFEPIFLSCFVSDGNGNTAVCGLRIEMR